MKKRIELIIILVMMVAIVMLGLWHVISTTLLRPSSPKIEISPLQNITYSNNKYGFAFTYPFGYLLTERSSTFKEERHYGVSLIRKEDSTPVSNGDGPHSINVSVYLATSSVFDWLKSPESNFYLGNQTYATTTINNLPTVQYRWDGLYQGETVAFEYLGNIIAFSVTFDSSNDEIKKDFEQLTRSIRLFDRSLTAEETAEVNKENVADYIKNHISELSSKKEVLGGKFYITSLKVGDNVGTVTYEDGHNAYKAHFTWTTDTKGQIKATSFFIDS